MIEQPTSPPIELKSYETIQLAFSGRWHNAANVKDGDQHVATLVDWTDVGKVYGSLPALERIQLRQPWSHVAKWGVEVWSPSMRILDEAGAVQIQCTRERYAQIFALFGDQRSHQQDLQERYQHHRKQGHSTTTEDTALIIAQGLPLPEEIAQPDSQSLKEGPLWLQVVAAIQHLRNDMNWRVRRGFEPFQRGGFDHNSHALLLNADIERVGSDNQTTTAVVLPTEQDKTGTNECLVDAQILKHQQLIESITNLLGNTSAEPTKRTQLVGMQKEKGATWKMQRQPH